MHNAPRADRRSVCTASNIIANGKRAVERQSGSPHVLQLAVYYSVHIFIYLFFGLPLSLLPPNPAILTHSARGGRSVDTDCVESDTAELAAVSHIDGTDQSGRWRGRAFGAYHL